MTALRVNTRNVEGRKCRGQHRLRCFGNVTPAPGAGDHGITKFDRVIISRPVIGPRIDVLESGVPDRHRSSEIADDIDDQKTKTVTAPVLDHKGGKCERLFVRKRFRPRGIRFLRSLGIERRFAYLGAAQAQARRLNPSRKGIARQRERMHG